jgi:hypothetical protein
MAAEAAERSAGAPEADPPLTAAPPDVELRCHVIFGHALVAAREFAAGEVVLSEPPLLSTGPAERWAGVTPLVAAFVADTLADAARSATALASGALPTLESLTELSYQALAFLASATDVQQTVLTALQGAAALPDSAEPELCAWAAAAIAQRLLPQLRSAGLLPGLHAEPSAGAGQLARALLVWAINAHDFAHSDTDT